MLIIVTPYVGVWIETLSYQSFKIRPQVTPYVGVWIETQVLAMTMLLRLVTPYVGVWIETDQMAAQFGIKASHPTWVCGLKLSGILRISMFLRVTPYVGVWIETFLH